MLLGQNKKPDIYKPNREGDVPFKALPIKISYNGYDILQDSEILGIVGTSQLANPGHKGSAAPEFTHYRLIVHIVVYRQSWGALSRCIISIGSLPVTFFLQDVFFPFIPIVSHRQGRVLLGGSYG